MTKTTALGTISKRADLSATYAAGSFMQRAAFAVFGLGFEAVRFVRTDGCACDVVEIYQVDPVGQDAPVHIGYAAGAGRKLMTDAVARRALQLLAVGAADTGSDFEQRVANLGW